MTTTGVHDNLASVNVAESASQPARLIDINRDAACFELRFPYDKEIVEAVKGQFPGRRFVKSEKIWRVPAGTLNASRVTSFAIHYDFALTQSAYDQVASTLEHMELRRRLAVEAEDSVIVDRELSPKLRPYQRVAVSYARLAKRAILALDVGLGKTVVALTALRCLQAYPAVVVMPASVKHHWAREIERWTPGCRVQVLEGANASELHGDADIYLVNYAVLASWQPALDHLDLEAVIFDEFHRCKNHKSQRGKAAQALVEGVDVRLGLTGTPIPNRPQELIHPLKILGRLEDVGGFATMAYRHCQAYQTKWGLDMSGAAHLDELHSKLVESGYIRRRKQDVMSDLPDLQRETFPIEIDNRKDYDEVERNVIDWLRSKAYENADEHVQDEDLPAWEREMLRRAYAEDKAERARRALVLVKLNELRQTAAMGKLNAVANWISDFIDDTGEPFVCFTHHSSVQDELIRRFDDVAWVRGQDDGDERQRQLDRFANGDTSLMVATIGAAGEGIDDLTVASHMGIVELPWSPKDLQQVEGRLWRSGQARAVNAYYFLDPHTIDAYMNDLIMSKLRVAEKTASGEEVDDTDIVGNVIERLKGE